MSHLGYRRTSNLVYGRTHYSHVLTVPSLVNMRTKSWFCVWKCSNNRAIEGTKGGVGPRPPSGPVMPPVVDGGAIKLLFSVQTGDCHQAAKRRSKNHDKKLVWCEAQF